jgi:shikimate kinase
MLILLIGPKGSGKSHIGRLLEASLGVSFFHVEPLWMDYHAQCREAGKQPTIAEGIEKVHPAIVSALQTHPHLCIETTGASPEILKGLLALGQTSGLLLVRIQAPLETCLDRIARRDPTHQIPTDTDTIKQAYRLSAALELSFDLTIENTDLTEAQILYAFRAALTDKGATPGP